MIIIVRVVCAAEVGYRSLVLLDAVLVATPLESIQHTAYSIQLTPAQKVRGSLSIMIQFTVRARLERGISPISQSQVASLDLLYVMERVRIHNIKIVIMLATT
jgi:hypothetical protein